MSLVKYNNNSISAVTSASSIPSGALTHIKTLTASSSATLSFVDGSNDVVLDNTYPIYKFEFINMHPATNIVSFNFNLSTDSGSNYNVTKTSSTFASYHNEAGNDQALSYGSSQDLAQSTGDQKLTVLSSLGNQNDESLSGYLHLFNPSSDVFVKHFIATTNFNSESDYQVNSYIAGYGNTISPINAIRFAMSSGNIDAGDICLYGIA